MADFMDLLPKRPLTFLLHDLKSKNKDKIDVLVIGNAGKEMFENSSYTRPFEYIDVPDDEVTIEHLRNTYENIFKI